jgi:hypothetical protein
MGLKPVSMTPLDLLPSVLTNGGEEVRTVVNCYELDISGSLAVLSSVTTKKTKETKGSSIIYWLKLFLGFSRLVMDRIRGYLGRLVGLESLDSKPNGFRPKTISKKPIIHLQSVCKSLGQGFKLFSRSSLQPKLTSVRAGTHRASDEISLPEILMEEGVGSELVEVSDVGGWV